MSKTHNPIIAAPLITFTRQFLGVVLYVANSYGADDLGIGYVRPLLESKDINAAEFYAVMDFQATAWAENHTESDPAYAAKSDQYGALMTNGDEPPAGHPSRPAFDALSAELDALFSQMVSAKLRECGLTDMADLRDTHPTIYDAMRESGAGIWRDAINLKDASIESPYLWAAMFNPSHPEAIRQAQERQSSSQA